MSFSYYNIKKHPRNFRNITGLFQKKHNLRFNIIAGIVNLRHGF
ncbi:hypothetical protein [Wolbachia pipientis]|nr:hypothetical protein [Wolbachia pipientis]